MADLAAGAGKGPSIERQIKAQIIEDKKRREDLQKRVDRLGSEKIPNNEKSYACADIRFQFKKCVMESECVTRERILPTQCLKERKVDPYCFDLQYGLSQCLRRKMDNRYRIVGPYKGITTNTQSGKTWS